MLKLFFVIILDFGASKISIAYEIGNITTILKISSAALVSNISPVITRASPVEAKIENKGYLENLQVFCSKLTKEHDRSIENSQFRHFF
jgi:hypothetical protein